MWEAQFKACLDEIKNIQLSYVAYNTKLKQRKSMCEDLLRVSSPAKEGAAEELGRPSGHEELRVHRPQKADEGEREQGIPQADQKHFQIV